MFARRRSIFLADLAVITLGALSITAAINALDINQRAVHVTAAALTVGVLAGVAVIAAAGARVQQDGRLAWIGAALGLLAAVALPLGALGPRDLQASSGLLVTWITAELAVVVLLLAAGWVPGPPGRLDPWMIGAVALGLAVVAGLVDAGLLASDMEAVRGWVAVIAGGWVLAALRTLQSALVRHDCTEWRIGLGLAAMTAAQVHDAVRGLGVGEVSSTAAGLWLIGSLGALAAALRSLRGEVKGLLTEREEQRAELHEAAQHVERAAAIAREHNHELANGLAGLAGIAYLLEQPAEQAGEAAALRPAVLAELARLHSMLVDSGQARGTYPSIDVTDLLRQLVVLHRAQGNRVELVAEHGLVARGRRDAVAQVVTNLLTNCKRHAPSSRVVIRAKGNNGRIGVEVADDGPGAPLGAEEKLVERGVTMGATGGSGLGLHVSRRLIVEQGGELHVVPEKGRGFRVRFTLPAADPENSVGAARRTAGRMAS